MAEFDTETPEITQEVSFSDDITDETENEIPVDPKKKKRKRRMIVFGIISGIIIVLIVMGIISHIMQARESQKNMYKDIAVERKTITKSITGSSSIDPNDSYNVTTIKTGDITADYFKEGDNVKKGDKLYQFDDEEARNNLKSAQNALTKAQQAYVDAVKQKSQTVSQNAIATKNSQNAIDKSSISLSDAKKSYDDQYIKSDISGKVAEVSVKEGDTVTNGTLLASVYDDRYMKIRIPFNDYDAEFVEVGSGAEVTVTGSGDAIYGTVTEKAESSVATSSHTIVVYVTIEVTNPGALTENDKGSAVVNGVACADSANFQYINTREIKSKASGTLKNLYISEGDFVYEGEQIAYVESDSLSSALDSAQINYDDAVLSLQKQVLANDTYSQDSAIKNAQLSLDDAKLNLQKAEDTVKDYVVEAPIDGTVVKKNAKNGDTREAGNNSSDALCVIYDLSSLKIKIDVDETEIALVKPGLKAKITADAVEGEFEGEVTKVPVDGVNENGVTTYTIEIQINNYGDLLPGMNVDAEIIVEEADNVLAIPVNSINRGNIVFVKDDGRAHEFDVTAAIKSRNSEAREDKDGKKNADNSRGDSPTDGNAPPNGGFDVNRVPVNLEVPEGYIAVAVETGLNDMDYVEIKSGLADGDTIRALNTENSSANLSFDEDDIMIQMEQNRNQQMRQMQQGGGMGGPPGGGGNRGGMGGPPGR